MLGDLVGLSVPPRQYGGDMQRGWSRQNPVVGEIVGDEEGGTHVYDALKFTHERTIEMPGTIMYVDL